MRWLSIAALGLLLMPAPALRAGETVAHPQLGFRLTVPDGFMQQDPSRAPGDVLFLFQRPPVGEQTVGTVIIVSRMGGMIGRERLQLKDIASKNPQVTLNTDRWKEFEIDVLRVPERIDGHELVTFNAQVPLKPTAVQIGVAGTVADEAELRNILSATLGGLDGQSNWLTQEERTEKLVTGSTRLIATVCILVAVGVAIVRAVTRRGTRRKPT